MSDSVGLPRAFDELAREELAELFRLEACLSRSETAAKYFAREHGSDRPVVVKVLLRPAEGRAEADERFRIAVSAVSTLEMHAVPVLSSGSTEHLYWYSTERAGERSVRNVLLALGPVVVKARERLSSQVASALDQVRRRGLARDVDGGAGNGQGNGGRERARDIDGGNGQGNGGREPASGGPDEIRQGGVMPPGRGLASEPTRDAASEPTRDAAPEPAPDAAPEPARDVAKEPERGAAGVRPEKQLDAFGPVGRGSRKARRRRRRDQLRAEPPLPLAAEGTVAGTGPADAAPKPVQSVEATVSSEPAGDAAPKPVQTVGAPADGVTPPAQSVAAAPKAGSVDDVARQELADRFRLDACISRDEEKAAYLARERRSDRAIVVYVLRRRAEGREDADARFRDTVAGISARAHARSMPVLDSGWTEHVYWYSMDQVRQRTLQNVLLAVKQGAIRAWRWIVALVVLGADGWRRMELGRRLRERFHALGPAVARARQWAAPRLARARERWKAMELGRRLREGFRALGPAAARARQWIAPRLAGARERWKAMELGRRLRERFRAVGPVALRVWRWIVARVAAARVRWQSLGLGPRLRGGVAALRPVAARVWEWIVELAASARDRWHELEVGRRLRASSVVVGAEAKRAGGWIAARASGVLGRLRGRGSVRGGLAGEDTEEDEQDLGPGVADAPRIAGSRGGELPDVGGWAGARQDATGQGRSEEEQWKPEPQRGAGGVGAGTGSRGREPVPGGMPTRDELEGIAGICPNCAAGQISPLTHRCELCGFAPGGTPLDDLAREELGEEFRLGALLGHGKTTAVFVARTHESEREIAVKVLPRPERQRSDADERFIRAVQAVAALEHPHIVPVFDHGWTEHLYWYSMDHVRGRSLRNYLQERAPLDLKACLRVTAQVASALDHAHRRGVVHGFLKPENVLIDAEGWVHLCDLLVTRALEPPPAAAPPPATPDAGDAAVAPPPALRPSEEDRSPYSAPEGLFTPSADQYALAVMVTECLSGVPHVEALLPGVPPHVRNAVERALSPMPMDRFGGVLEFVAALETFTTPALEARPAGRPSGILRISDYKAPPRPSQRRLIRVGAVAVVVLAILMWQRSNVVRLLHRGGAPAQLVPVVTTAIDSTPRLARQRAEALRQSGRSGPTPPARPIPPPTPASTEPGKLFVNATPWGQLYIDGQLAGNTPKANLPLPVGLHAIRVLREGYEPFDRIVRVEAGQTVRLTDITLVQRP